MKHLGDITKISGYTAPIVDCIIGGSPCQDLSVAGKRAGLDGERSGLFMDQIRIIKEMRDRDERSGRTGADVRPRYMVWENVPGAFSSNKGEDFRVVLEETAKVADKDAVIPRPEDGKWATSGCIVAEGYSIAWKILDAQFWGVPQRRRRIALVADFGGQSASEILFVRKGVSGNTEPGKQERKAAPSDVTGCTEADDSERVPYTLKIRSGCEGGGKGALIQTDKSATLSTLQDQTLFQPVDCDIYGLALSGDKAVTLTTQSNATGSGKVQTLTSRMGKGGGNVPMVMMEAFQHYGYRESDVSGTLTAGQNSGVRGDTPLVIKGPGAVCYGIGAYHSNAWKSDNPHSGVYEADTAKTLDALNCGYPACNQGGIAVVHKGSYIVRRLTPLECERLQGFPDGWTDIGEWVDSKGKVKKTSDSARYKALGNSIALPPWKWVLKRICACYERDATMASLFDGIGGFPYIWEQFNGKGSCLWASEIEEFPIAVTKVRFGECT